MDIQQIRPLRQQEAIAEAAAIAESQDLKTEVDDELDIETDKEGELQGADESEKEYRLRIKRLRAKKKGKSSARTILDGEYRPKDIVKQMAEKMAEKNIANTKELPPDLKEKIEKSIKEQLLAKTPENFDDRATLSQSANAHTHALLQRAAEKQAKNTQEMVKDNQKHVDKTQLKLPTEAQAGAKMQQSFKQRERLQEQRFKQETQSVTKYLTLLAEASVKGGQEKVDQVRHAREKLLTQGISPKRLHGLESSVNKFLRKDLKSKIKDSFFKLALSFDQKAMTTEIITQNQEFRQLAALAKQKNLFGPGRDSMDSIRDEARDELKGYLSNEMDNLIMESKVKGESTEKLIDAFNKLNDLAGVAKFDASEYMKHVQRKIEDWGLNDFKNPDLRGQMDTETGSDQDSNKQQQERSDVELLEDDLRNVLMKNIVKRDFRSIIQNGLKIRQIKRQLKESGDVSEERLIDIENEARGMAKMKLMDMVRESMEEKASLAKLKGPEYDLSRKKLKSALKRLRDLDVPIPKEDLRVMQHQINTKMFSIVKEEYTKQLVGLNANPNDVYLKKSVRDMETLLKRLKAESRLPEAIEPSINQSITFSAETNIIEAA